MAQVGDPDFHLKSENHVSALVQKFHILLEKEKLVDVTLSTTEGQYLKAHRLVLLASSQYFEELFTLPRLSDTSLAEITLPQIGYEDLKIVVQYMYRGEITVPRHQLSSLLEAASTLKIPDLISQLQEVMSYYEQSNDSFNPLQLQRSDDYAAIDSRSKVSVFAAISNQPQTGLMDDEVGGYGITFVAPADQHQLPFLETVDGDPLLTNQDDVSTSNHAAADPHDPGWDDGARPLTRAEFLAAKAEYLEWAKTKQLHPVASKSNEDQEDAAQKEDTMEESYEQSEEGDLNQPSSLDDGVDESSSTAASLDKENSTPCSETGPTPSNHKEQNNEGEEEEEDEEEDLTSSEDYSQDSHSASEYEPDVTCEDEDFKTTSSTTRFSKRKRENSAKPSSMNVEYDNEESDESEHSSNESVDTSDYSSEIPFKCKNCGSSFKSELYYKQHLARACGIEAKFSCQECGRRFKVKFNLQRHLKKIHNVEESQLPKFGAGPVDRSALPYKCLKCGRTYKLENSLACHLKNGCRLSRSFPCTLCSYRAMRKSNLRQHLRAVHTVDRSQLDTCGPAAKRVRPELPFKCNGCQRTYKTKGTLKRHLATVQRCRQHAR